MGRGLEEAGLLGRDALSAERSDGAARTLWGIEALERAIPRSHMPVHGPDGATVGEVTSGTFSPTLKKGIGLALIARDSGLAEGDEAAIDVRGRPAAVRLVKPPFVESHVR